MTQPAGTRGPSQDQAEIDLHYMGGDTGPTPSPSRGGGGLGPQEVRETDERNRKISRQDAGD